MNYIYQVGLRCDQVGKNRKKLAKYRRYIACRWGAKRQMEEISRRGDFSPKNRRHRINRRFYQ